MVAEKQRIETEERYRALLRRIFPDIEIYLSIKNTSSFETSVKLLYCSSLMSQEDVFVINIISSVRALLLVVLVLVSMIYHVIR